MFRSNIKTAAYGPFSGPMIVSMRAIRKDKLSLVASLTWPVKNGHGSPIHYGDPGLVQQIVFFTKFTTIIVKVFYI